MFEERARGKYSMVSRWLLPHSRREGASSLVQGKSLKGVFDAVGELSIVERHFLRLVRLETHSGEPTNTWSPKRSFVPLDRLYT